MIILLVINSYCSTMMVDLPFIITSKSVHVCMKQHHYEGVEQVKQEPGVHHLHVGSFGQAIAHIDKHGC